MRKVALLLAAALIVSVPVLAVVSTDSYAATTKKGKDKKVVKRGKTAKVARVQAAPRSVAPAPAAPPERTFANDPNTAFIRALGDLFNSLGRPRDQPATAVPPPGRSAAPPPGRSAAPPPARGAGPAPQAAPAGGRPAASGPTYSE